MGHLNEKIQLAAMRQDGFAIRHIDDPSEEVQLAAVGHNNSERNPDVNRKGEEL